MSLLCGITLRCKFLVVLLRLQVIVSPGSTAASTSEAEGDASPAMDSLVEGVAGRTGYFYIQVMQWDVVFIEDKYPCQNTWVKLCF